MAKKSSGGSCGGRGGQVRRLDTFQFDQAIAALGEANNIFRQAKDTINNQTKQLLENWQGQGHTQFSQTYWRLKRELDDEEELLTAMKKDLEGILRTYQQWDQSMAQSISGDDYK